MRRMPPTNNVIGNTICQTRRNEYRIDNKTVPNKINAVNTNPEAERDLINDIIANIIPIPQIHLWRNEELIFHEAPNTKNEKALKRPRVFLWMKAPRQASFPK